MFFSPPVSLAQCASEETTGKHREKEKRRKGVWISYDLKEIWTSRGEWGLMDGACHVLEPWDSGRSGPRLLCGGSGAPGPWCGSGYGDWPGPAGMVWDTQWTTMTRSKRNRRWCALRYGHCYFKHCCFFTDSIIIINIAQIISLKLIFRDRSNQLSWSAAF